CAETPVASAVNRSRFGNNLCALFGARTKCALSVRGRSGRGPRALARRPPDHCATCFTSSARLALVASKSPPCHHRICICLSGNRRRLAFAKPVASSGNNYGYAGKVLQSHEEHRGVAI